ncbi:hypothetical protein [Cellulomonas carbonis]|uniref:Uncharacterized protein n=1 Tax=Cellulomonas carbonis T26 TaxID=947969 RepID=A0A0A0BM15_9CELL|nr:hypothetical protein [Cellulomonas carbonis]KGM08930.1 hypothetical protein N868_04560 [Cellulomonas carbonis T26]GGC02284.1 hypothetical protein GCM10010972_14030 [Cellulomonas carbonis]
MVIRRTVLPVSAALAVACVLTPSASAVTPAPTVAGVRPVVGGGLEAASDDAEERPGWDRIRGRLSEPPWVLEEEAATDDEAAVPADGPAEPADPDATDRGGDGDGGDGDAATATTGGRIEAGDGQGAASRSTARDARLTGPALLERVAVARRSSGTPLVPARPTWPGVTFPA